MVLAVCSLLTGVVVVDGFAQDALRNRQYLRNKVLTRAVHNNVPDGYQQLGTTDLYYTIKTGGIDAGGVRIGSIDLIGKFGDQYYSSTYSDNGYVVAMKVEDNTAVFADCLTGTTVDGVEFSASIAPQGEMARITYHITNTDSVDKSVSVGAYDDAYVGNRIDAAINKKNDSLDNTYGISLSDHSGAELCVIFGDGLTGVTGVDDFWFGSYYINTSAENMSGSYSSDGDYNYMVENGSYDCGIGWCWKNRTVKAGETLNLSYLIAIGDVNLEPNSSFEVTPDDPEGWNDLSRPHRLTLEGVYESPAGLEGKIEYAVEDSEEWLSLTGMLSSGSTFSESLVAMFDASREKHVIRFRAVDNVGNATLLPSIEYIDVSFYPIEGIESSIYTGDSLYQSNLTCEIPSEKYIVTNYQNNLNVGVASFNVEGLFPYSIGRKSYFFDIVPQPLEGGIIIETDTVDYDGNNQCPLWSFIEPEYSRLIEGKDYVLSYKDNLLPGIATLQVEGIGNYGGVLSANFFIDKAQLTDSLYSVKMPPSDISHDGESHAATVSKIEGVGDVMITYVNTEDNSVSTEAPVNTGSYDVYAEFAEGTLYYGKANEKIGSFAIYHFDENEWLALNVLNTQLQENGWTTLWDMSAGPVAVGKFDGLVIEQGHVVGVEFINKELTGVPTGLLAFPQLRAVDLSHNALTGNVGLFATQLPNLTSLNLSYNQFSDLFPMISPSVTFLDVSHQTIDKTITLNLSDFKIEDIATTVPTILLYDHAAQTYNPNMNLMCTTAESNNIGPDDWAMQIAVNNGSISLPYVSPNNAYYGESGDILNVFDMNSGSSFKVALDFNRGDANFVGGIDATDLQATILYAFGGYRNYPFNFTAADTYKDGNINVQDVICTVNILLAQADMQLFMKKKTSRMDVADAEAVIYMQDGNIILRSEKQVAAICVRANGNVEWHLDKYGLEQTVVGGKAVGYSLTGGTLPVGETVIGSYTGNASVEYASLADQEAQNVTVLFGKDSVTGIQSVKELMDGDAQFYDVTGRRIERLNKGVNIIKSGNRTIKVINGMNR